MTDKHLCTNVPVYLGRADLEGMAVGMTEVALVGVPAVERLFDREAMRRIEAIAPAFHNGSGRRSAVTQLKRAKAC